MNLIIHIKYGKEGEVGFYDHRIFYNYKGNSGERGNVHDYLRHTLELINEEYKPEEASYELASELVGIFKTIADFLEVKKKYEKK